MNQCYWTSCGLWRFNPCLRATHFRGAAIDEDPARIPRLPDLISLFRCPHRPSAATERAPHVDFNSVPLDPE